MIRIILIIAIAGILLVPAQSFAHHKICEICGQPADTKKYLRVQMILFVDKANEQFMINVKNKLLSDEGIYQFKEVAISPRSGIADVDGNLLVGYVAFTFLFDSEAQKVYNELITAAQNNSEKIEFGAIRIMENSHHYPNPQPDNILLQRSMGSFADLNNRYNLDFN